jgi:dienelactone hydrolase
VAFSHGNSGLRRQSTFLTTHLASWGMVVTAPDHTGNTLFDVIGIRDDEERRRVHRQARSNRPRDMAAAIESVLDPQASERGRWPDLADDRIGALGHSYGGCQRVTAAFERSAAWHPPPSPSSGATRSSPASCRSRIRFRHSSYPPSRTCWSTSIPVSGRSSSGSASRRHWWA